MTNCTLSRRWVLLTATIISIGLLGCSRASTKLPETVTVSLPDGTQTEVTLGAGVLSLADTTWDFYQVYDGGSTAGNSFVRISFGPQGELSSFANSTFAPEIFGDEIIFDGEVHATNQQGLSYAAATYGAETSDASGFAFVSNIRGLAPVIGTVAEATANATGEFDDEDPDVMTGSFTFAGEITIELPGIPMEPFEDEMNFVARRVNDE